MAKYNPSGTSAPYSGDDGNAGVYVDETSVSAAPALNDILNLVKIPAGTKVHRVVIKNSDMDSNVSPAMAAKIGFAACDGSAMPSGADTAVAAAGAFGQAAATTTYEIFPPYVVDKDCYLQAVVTTAPATGATGTIDSKIEAEILGAK